MIQPEGE